jgi:hypothetical protein
MANRHGAREDGGIGNDDFSTFGCSDNRGPSLYIGHIALNACDTDEIPSVLGTLRLFTIERFVVAAPRQEGLKGSVAVTH